MENLLHVKPEEVMLENGFVHLQPSLCNSYFERYACPANGATLKNEISEKDQGAWFVQGGGHRPCTLTTGKSA